MHYNDSRKNNVSNSSIGLLDFVELRTELGAPLCFSNSCKQVLDTRGRLLTALGYGLWPSMVLLSEIVQTFILADFCYYYVKRYTC